jgi:hypothetical protein
MAMITHPFLSCLNWRLDWGNILCRTWFHSFAIILFLFGCCPTLFNYWALFMALGLELELENGREIQKRAPT